MAGHETVTLTIAQLPPHSHRLMAADTPGDSNTPANNTVLSALGGQAAAGEYATPAYAPPGHQTALNGASVASSGGSQPHNNIQPYLAITFCIALGGTMPA
jgi:microcystin-dependent protein